MIFLLILWAALTILFTYYESKHLRYFDLFILVENATGVGIAIFAAPLWVPFALIAWLGHVTIWDGRKR